MAILLNPRMCIHTSSARKDGGNCASNLLRQLEVMSQHACTVAAIHPRPHPDAKVQRTQCTTQLTTCHEHTSRMLCWQRSGRDGGNCALSVGIEVACPSRGRPARLPQSVSAHPCSNPHSQLGKYTTTLAFGEDKM